jgi:hypothetical protein|tara:strand:- start:371 stop:601 length:231 start_codon:yes stop_codon:yes gene_type:complete
MSAQSPTFPGEPMKITIQKDSQWRTYRGHGVTVRIPQNPAQSYRGFVRPAWGNVFYATPRDELAKVLRAMRNLVKS